MTRLTPALVASPENIFLRRRHLAKSAINLCTGCSVANSGVDGENFSQLTSVQGGTLILGIEANPWNIMDVLSHYKDE